MSSKKIVIFASGSGSSAENIILTFKNKSDIVVTKLYCNKPDAFVLQRIKKYNIEALDLKIRHSRTLGGSFHCCTADMIRL